MWTWKVLTIYIVVFSQNNVYPNAVAGTQYFYLIATALVSLVGKEKKSWWLWYENNYLLCNILCIVHIRKKDQKLFLAFGFCLLCCRPLCIHKILEGDMIHLKNKMNTSCQQFIKTPVILIIVSFSASAFSYLFLFASCTSTNQWLKGMLRMQADE